MKTAETISTSSQHRSQSSQPFFQKEGVKGLFFSENEMKVQTKPFFDIAEQPVDVQMPIAIGKDPLTDGENAPNQANGKDDHSQNPSASDNLIIQTKCAECEQEEQVQMEQESIPNLNAQDQAVQEQAEDQPLELQKDGSEIHKSEDGLQPAAEVSEVQAKPIFESEVEPAEEQVQTKSNNDALTIGQPDDQYEREADAMADQVVQKLSQHQVEDEPEEDQVTESDQNLESETDSTPEVQQKPIFESEATEENIQTKSLNGSDTINLMPNSEAALNTSPTPLQASCELCEKEEQEEMVQEQPELQKRPIFDSADDPPNENGPSDIQRFTTREREKADYPILFKRVPQVQLSGGSGSESSIREKIVKEAQEMVGKIEAKKDDGSGRRVGADHLLDIFHLAAKDAWSDEVIEYVKYPQANKSGLPHWCGIFAVYAVKKAGIDLGYWEPGRGVSRHGTLEPTDDPQPGDIGYFHEKSHHCIIKSVNGDTIESIDGNSGNFSEVIEKTRTRSEYRKGGFFTAFTGSEKVVQKKEESEAATHSQPDLKNRLDSSAGNGSPLDNSTRSQMESGFGADFSEVSIHTDSKAEEMNKDLHAQAFTHGSDIYFNKGQYNPETSSGKHLLAHELTHTLQQGASLRKSSGYSNFLQLAPQAGRALPSTPKQRLYDKHRDEVMNIMGEGYFNPSRGLANYIASLWENHQSAPVNIKFGQLAEGYIWIDQVGRYLTKECLNIPLSLFLLLKICRDVVPKSRNYQAAPQVIPLKHPAFAERSDGTLVLVVGISRGIIYGKIGWIKGKKADQIDPLLDATSVYTKEETFLPFIFGNDYSGDNYKSKFFQNKLSNGLLAFSSHGDLSLSNQQHIEGLLFLLNGWHFWLGKLHGDAKGLKEYDVDIERTPFGSLFGESTEFQLDKTWTTGNKDTEDGKFTVSGNLRASYKDRILEVFGKATYSSARINGEVNLALLEESKANALFESHAPAKQTEENTTSPTSTSDQESKPLALTAWGNLKFKVIDVAGNTSKGKAADKGSKTANLLKDLEGEGAFAVHPEGYIILSGKLKFPTNWKFTPPYDYKSDKAKNKHLFEKQFTVVRAPVPYGTVELNLGTTFDVGVHIDPLELYEIEVSGTYSNHPKYRSEVGLSPKFYISGNANAKLVILAAAKAKALGLFTVGKVQGDLTGNAKFDAYINATPAVGLIWDGGDQQAQYNIAGTIHAGGELTFALSGSISIEVIKKEIAKTKDYEIGSWTLNSFGFAVILNEYIIGSGAKPKLDFSKMKFGEKQRKNLGRSIVKGKEVKEGDIDKQSGGFEQIEDGKTREVGEFSSSEPTPKDLDTELIGPQSLKSQFFMEDKLHSLILQIAGTRAKPTASLEMASDDKKPLREKIIDERIMLEITEIVTPGKELDKQLQQQQNDLDSLDNEASSIEKNAKNTAQNMDPDENLEVAGFDHLDDRLSTYANKYNTDDLGGKSVKELQDEATEEIPETQTKKGHGCSAGEVENLAQGLNDGWSEHSKKYFFRNKGAGCYAFHFDDGGLIVVRVSVRSGKSGYDAINSAFAGAKGQFNGYGITLPGGRWIPSGNAGKNQYHSENLILDYLRQLGRGASNGRIVSVSVRIFTLLTPCDRCDPLLNSRLGDVMNIPDKELDYQSGYAPAGKEFIKDANDHPPYPTSGSKTVIPKNNPNHDSADSLTKDQDPNWFKTFKT